jgi:curved DNA-binding protein CbpA
MKNRRNYYRILHVQPDAPVEIIESSYRTLMSKLKKHPDLGGDHWNAVLINEARDVLTDEKRRAEYDRDFLNSKNGSSEFTNKPFEQRESKPFTSNKPHASSGPCCFFCNTPNANKNVYATDSLCTQCGSPVEPVNRVKLEDACQRAIKRFARTGELVFYTQWPQEQGFNGKILDLSLHGMRFSCKESLRENQIIKIESKVVHATAKVVASYHQASKWLASYAIGTEFLSVHFKDSNGVFISQHA